MTWFIFGRTSAAKSDAPQRCRTPRCVPGATSGSRLGSSAAEALAAFDKIVGLDLSDVSLDGLLHKAPAGGEGTGKNPTDRGKLGWKWSILVDRYGIPLGWVADGANRNDSVLLAPTLDDAKRRGLLQGVVTIWLDRGYDSEATRQRLIEHELDDAVIAKKRKRGSNEPKRNQPMGLHWPVERTNSWLSNFGGLRRNTDTLTELPQEILQLSASPNSLWPWSSCSPPSSSTGETAGHRHRSLSAEPLTQVFSDQPQ